MYVRTHVHTYTHTLLYDSLNQTSASSTTEVSHAYMQTAPWLSSSVSRRCSSSALHICIHSHIHMHAYRTRLGCQALYPEGAHHQHYTYKYTHSLSHTQTAPWLSSSVSRRFSSPECVETRTWEELAEVMRDKEDMFTTGSLGNDKTVNFHVWACFKDHSCLSVVSHGEGDAMCYVFHEEEETWYPWGLSGEVFGGCAAQ
jgi:hypothetical protein